MALIEVYNSELDAIAKVPARALPGYLAKGWEAVEDVEATFPVVNDGEIDWDLGEDDLDSDEEASNQEDD